jgi:SAM-dependent methyltransferase
MSYLRKIYKRLFRTTQLITNIKTEDSIDYFLKNGKIPWSKGYNDYKWQLINSSINNTKDLEGISKKELNAHFGHRVDERLIEYTWVFSNLSDKVEKLLDAGSTFNFKPIVEHTKIESKDVTIFTFAPEGSSFNKKGISYVYGDLRNLPFKDSLFDVVVSQSTIEHIDMDNSMYGYELDHNINPDKKSYEYILAIKEMIRVLNNKGTLLLTFPFGKFENHGFFQQFDREMLNRITSLYEGVGAYQTTFFKYEPKGWRFAEIDEVMEAESYNPHTNKGKKDDFAAHSRAIACVKFLKY